VLGVAPDSSYDELKKAYAAKAFRLHPDLQGGADEDQAEAAAWRMRELNASWSVLRDSADRKQYDAELASQRRPAPSGGTWSVAADDGLPRVEPDDDAPLGVAEHALVRFAPVVVLAVVLLALLIVTAYASSGTDDNRPLETTEYAPVGSCVELGSVPDDPDVAATTGPELIEVDCGRVGSSRVVAKVSMNRPCPTGTTAFPVPGERLAICLD
jgi:hypothetical protein